MEAASLGRRHVHHRPVERERPRDQVGLSMLTIFNVNTAEVWLEAKERAAMLRRHRDDLHPGLADELRQLEEAGY